jgi:gliding motility-associated-like protein
MKHIRVGLFLVLLICVELTVAADRPGKLLNPGKVSAFDCPQIDESGMTINPSACSGADGSIVGIKGMGGSGSYHFIWRNAELDIVSRTADLLGVKPGVYTLTFSDESKCLAIKRSYTVGEKDGVIIDESNIQIKQANCNASDGSITHLNIQNATQYQWYGLGGIPIASTADLTGVSSGSYTLVASNASGCSLTKMYVVPSTAYFPTVTKVDTLPGHCNYDTGSLILTFNSQPEDPIYTYTLYSEGSHDVVSGSILYTPNGSTKITLPIGAPNSPNSLVVRDPNGCTAVIGLYSLPAPVFTIVTQNLIVKDDACGRHTGGVFGLDVLGGQTPKRPFGNPPNQVWTWTDEFGKVVGHLPNLADVGAGTYTLNVKDINGCTDSRQFTVSDNIVDAKPPILNDITLCLPGTTNLAVDNPNPKFTYRLYDATKTPVTENHYGIFQQKVTQTSTFYVTTTDGLCESSMTPVTVTVIAPGVVIPNTFTPNNDGINDLWIIPHIDQFPGADVSVYNRDGQLVYHSIDYSHPFDGTLNGSKLPVGSYYYIIDLKQPECIGKISGSLTLIR